MLGCVFEAEGFAGSEACRVSADCVRENPFVCRMIEANMLAGVPEAGARAFAELDQRRGQGMGSGHGTRAGNRMRDGDR
jgi:hypothetical protein